MARPSLDAVVRAGFGSEADLARSLIAGDVRAPSVAWNHYAPMVREVVRRSFGRCAEVEDLTQEVFLRLFRRVATLRKPESLRSFVLSFAFRTVKSERRRRRRVGWLVLTDTGRLAGDDGEATDVDNRLELRRAQVLLHRLSARERDVLFLSRVDGLKLTDIASRLRVSLSTTKRVLRRARLRIAVLDANARRARWVRVPAAKVG
jgi:RNA polymerase sigma-70 factor (ECF subfamily)